MEIDRKALSEIRDKLTPIAERSPMVDSRNLALLNMRLIEVLLGDEPATDLPQRHHQ